MKAVLARRLHPHPPGWWPCPQGPLALMACRRPEACNQGQAIQHDRITAWKLQLRPASLRRRPKAQHAQGDRKGTESNRLLSGREGPGSCAWQWTSGNPGGRAGSLQMLQRSGGGQCPPSRTQHCTQCLGPSLISLAPKRTKEPRIPGFRRRVRDGKLQSEKNSLLKR